MMKAKRNAEYLAHLDRSFAPLERGEVIVKIWKNWSVSQINDLYVQRNILRLYESANPREKNITSNKTLYFNRIRRLLQL